MSKKKGKEVVVKEETQNNLNSLSEQVQENIMDAYSTAEFMIERNLLPKKSGKWTPEQVLLLIEIGRSVGLTPLMSVNSINFIEGRPSFESRIIPGLLAQKGIALRVIQDYEPIFEEKPVPMTDEDGKVKLDEQGRVVYFRDDAGEKIIKKKEVDRITTLEILRDFGGAIGVVKNQMSFRLSDAKAAGWYPQKANWVKMPRAMLYARCLSRIARAFASDVIAGLYEASEIQDFAGSDDSPTTHASYQDISDINDDDIFGEEAAEVLS